MLLTKINSRLHIKNFLAYEHSRRFESIIAPKSREDVETPIVYPSIADIEFRGKWVKYREDWNEAVQKIKTAEEKMIKINMPRYWGFRSMMYEEGKITYNELPHAQFITRTHVMKESALPRYYDNIIKPEELNNLIEDIKQSIENGIAFELSLKKNLEKPHDLINIDREIDDMNGNIVSKQVNRIMLASLANKYPHLVKAQADIDPRIEAFWFVGGITPTRCAIYQMKKRRWHAILNEPLNKPMQYIGKPSLQLRHNLPLKEILPISECENSKWEVPFVKYDPRTFGHCMKRRHGTTIPGFWPGDTNEFGILSYHTRGYLLNRPKGTDDDFDALKTQAILANYSWLLGQASHLGFSTFNDVTYPLVNQSITTNGQFWSFCVYQLNTTLVNAQHSETNPKKNICWITEPLKLYEKIENGKLIGFNDEVLKNLIKFYVNVPQKRINTKLKPYVDNMRPQVAKIKCVERRIWLEETYKRLMSNRPRHRLMPELYHWEIIYKHMFNTRPMDKRRKPWDYGINPLIRPLDDVQPAYIPKVLRVGKRDNSKFGRTYFPK